LIQGLAVLGFPRAATGSGVGAVVEDDPAVQASSGFSAASRYTGLPGADLGDEGALLAGEPDLPGSAVIGDRHRSGHLAACAQLGVAILNRYRVESQRRVLVLADEAGQP
jgi:hypothetical protein